MDDLLNELGRDRPDDQGQRDRRRRVATAAVLAGLAFVGIGLSGAVFGDTQTLGTNDFTTGTVRLGTNPTATVVSAGNMAPGDEAFGDVRVDNTGSLQLRYALAATADDPDGKGLNTQLRLSVYSGLTQLQCAAGNVGLGTLEGGPSALGAPVKVFGDSNQGIDVGDRVLDAGASERLCVRVALPLATGNAYQNATSTITLTFDAEQTANNMTVNP